MKQALRWVHAAEEGLLALLLLLAIVLASAEVVLRLFDQGQTWIGPLVKVLVLWLGLLGALLATRDNQHISIDLLSRVLGEQGKRWARAFTALFAAIVCGITAWHSIEFVQGSLEYADTVSMGKQDVAAWIVQLVIPLSFALMAVRFALHSVGFAVVEDYQPTPEPPAQQDEEGA